MIRNFTPHLIRVLSPDGVTYDPKARKHVLEGEPTVIAEIPSDGVLSAEFASVDVGSIDGIPLTHRMPILIEPLPDGDDYIIVSLVYASAAKEGVPSVKIDVNRLLTVGDTVYKDGKPFGCLSLVRV